MVVASDRYCVSTLWFIDRSNKGECFSTVYLYDILERSSFFFAARLTVIDSN